MSMSTFSTLKVHFFDTHLHAYDWRVFYDAYDWPNTNHARPIKLPTRMICRTHTTLRQSNCPNGFTLSFSNFCFRNSNGYRPLFFLILKKKKKKFLSRYHQTESKPNNQLLPKLKMCTKIEALKCAGSGVEAQNV